MKVPRLIVNVTPQTGENPNNEGEGSTLADVIYADQTKVRASEQEWVKLVQGIAAGDQAALCALYERSHRAVFTLILRITSNRQTAEELTMDVFHDVWRKASTYDPTGGTVLGWIMNQARSRAIDRVRFDNRAKRVDPYPDAPPLPLQTERDQGALLDMREQERVLCEALKELTAGERAAIETAFFSELTHAETAAQLKQPLGTIKTRIRSGLDKLRGALTNGKEES